MYRKVSVADRSDAAVLLEQPVTGPRHIEVLDGGTNLGAPVEAHFDSLLVKLTSEAALELETVTG